MVTLKQLQSQYQSQVETNLSVQKKRRRYSIEFKTDMQKYISDGGSKVRLSKWFGMGMDSQANHMRKTDSSYVADAIVAEQFHRSLSSIQNVG